LASVCCKSKCKRNWIC